MYETIDFVITRLDKKVWINSLFIKRYAYYFVFTVPLNYRLIMPFPFFFVCVIFRCNHYVYYKFQLSNLCYLHLPHITSRRLQARNIIVRLFQSLSFLSLQETIGRHPFQFLRCKRNVQNCNSRQRHVCVERFSLRHL